MKAALYLRVSADRQELENQERQLREWADREGHEVVAIYSDTSSGGNDYRTREGLYKLLHDAKSPRRKFDLVVFWALDRLTREGALKCLGYLEVFKGLGIGFHSYTEAYLSSLGPFADVVVSLIGTLAKMERERISERTKAGLETARRRGKVIGRPNTAVRQTQDILDLYGSGIKPREIAGRLRISETSVRRIYRGRVATPAS